MDDQDWLAGRFEANHSHLRGVAFRMPGSMTEADDAVQEFWIRLSRPDTSDVDNLRAWLTTVVGRVCLNMLRSRKTRREPALETHLPDPILSPEGRSIPSRKLCWAIQSGSHCSLVLDSLTPAERVAFVLHDDFAVPFDEIAPIVGRTPTAARQLASRARRRVRGAPVIDVDLDGQWAVVDAFLAASRIVASSSTTRVTPAFRPRGRQRPGSCPAPSRFAGPLSRPLETRWQHATWRICV